MMIEEICRQLLNRVFTSIGLDIPVIVVYSWYLNFNESNNGGRIK